MKNEKEDEKQKITKIKKKEGGVQWVNCYYMLNNDNSNKIFDFSILSIYLVNYLYRPTTNANTSRKLVGDFVFFVFFFVFFFTTAAGSFIFDSFNYFFNIFSFNEHRNSNNHHENCEYYWSTLLLVIHSQQI